MPDDVALEKVNALRCLGATVERVRPASIIDTKHVRPLRLAPCTRAVLNLVFFSRFSMWCDVPLVVMDTGGADLHNHPH